MHAPKLLSLLLLISVTSVLAQDDAKHHRAVYAEINDNLNSYKKIKTVFRDGELEFQLESWWDNDAVRRIDSRVAGEDGDGNEEYYIEDGKLLFAFRYYRAMSAEEGAKGVLVEDRFYFNDGQMFKWIGTDKKLVSKEDEIFQVEAERLTTNLASFLSALEREMSPATAVTQTSGMFQGIEQGDYGHWNMEDSNGNADSFFILQPDETLDEVLANPEVFVGRKCTVKWKTSKENIPEAGGILEVKQILSVEWLAKE